MAKEVIMPALGMAQDTGTLIQWLKAPGETVRKGEPLMEIETDKATVEVEAPASGTLSNVTAQPGDVIPVGHTIALILSPGEATPQVSPAPVAAIPAATPIEATPLHAVLPPNTISIWRRSSRSGGGSRKRTCWPIVGAATVSKR